MASPKLPGKPQKPVGVWSVKDTIGHLTSYEEVLIDILSGFVSRQPTPSLYTYIEPGGKLNDVEEERRKDKTMKEVLDEFKMHTRR